MRDMQQLNTLLCMVLCSKYDLYSKSNVRIDVEEVKPYYMSLIEKVYANVLDQLIMALFS
jgi:inositol oxygenase